MNLGQMMMVAAALFLLGILVLRSNTGLLASNATIHESDFNITGISLANSIIEEAMGKLFDSAIKDTTSNFSSPNILTPIISLGPSGGESYRGSIDFDDFDDFNGLFLVFKSSNPADTARTTGSHYETIVPGIQSKYFVKAKVDYVAQGNLNGVSSVRTWHKKLSVTVTRPLKNPTSQDTLVIAGIMSFWR